MSTHDQQVGLEFFHHFRDGIFRTAIPDFYFNSVTLFFQLLSVILQSFGVLGRFLIFNITAIYHGPCCLHDVKQDVSRREPALGQSAPYCKGVHFTEIDRDGYAIIDKLG